MRREPLADDEDPGSRWDSGLSRSAHALGSKPEHAASAAVALESLILVKYEFAHMKFSEAHRARDEPIIRATAATRWRRSIEARCVRSDASVCTLDPA